MQWVWADPSEQLLPCPERSCNRLCRPQRSDEREPSCFAALQSTTTPAENHRSLTARASLQWVVSYFAHMASLAEGQRRIWEPKSIAASSFPVRPQKKLFYLRSSRGLWIKTETLSSHSTLHSAHFWVSAVLALHCWASYPCWGLQCNSHSFYILCKK